MKSGRAIARKAEARMKVSQPAFIYSESDPFERVETRLIGLAELATEAAIAGGQPQPPTHKVMCPIWSLVAVVLQDIRRDLYQVLDERAQPGDEQA